MRNKNNEPCTVDGCTRKLYVKGMCTLHYQRFMKHGDPSVNPNARREPIDRFWEKVDKTDGCWTWKAFKSPHGYPRFFAGDKREGTILAHRWIFSHVNGPIPQDMHVDHICRNRACVRPDHLRLLTAAENGLYAQQSCRWVAKSLDDIKTLAAENVKSISVDKAVVLCLIARIERTTAHVQPVNTSSERVENASGNEQVERAAAPHGSAAPTEAVPVPFRVGNEYQTQTGEWVRFVGVAKEGTDYETMFDEKGVHRYTSRDFGRVTGTAHDYSYPDNTPPLYRHPASQRAAVSAATKPTADLSKLERYVPCGVGHMGADEEGMYVLLADVQSLLATKPAAAPAVPEGFVLVPKVPTDEMRDAGNVIMLDRGKLFQVWRAMLAAAPAASTIGAAQTADQVPGDNA